MKTTIDVPDQLLRRTKAFAAINGLTLREIVVSAMEDAVSKDSQTAPPPDRSDWMTEWDALGKRVSRKWNTRRSVVELVREGRR